MTRKSGRTGSTSTASRSSSPRNHLQSTTTPPSSKAVKRSSGGVGGGGAGAGGLTNGTTMTKAPRVNGVSERTSPVKSLHHLHNGGDSSVVLENGFHDTTTPSSTKTNSSSMMRSKKELANDHQQPLVLNGLDQSSPVSLNITGNSSSNSNTKSGSYLSPNNRSPINSNAPLYKVIDKSMSYTKSPQLLSPGSAASQQSRVHSPTTPTTNEGTRLSSCQSITKTPAEEVKSNRRGTGQPLSPATSPLKSPPLLSATRGDPSKRSKQLRKTELSLLNDEAENFMFPKAKEEDLDSDSSDVIVIVKGKKKTKAKQMAEASASNVDDRTMALIKSEMGEEECGEEDEEEEEEVFEDAQEEAGEKEDDDDDQELDKVENASMAKAVNLLPLKKRFSASKAMKGAKKAAEVAPPEASVSVTMSKKSKKKGKAVPKKGGKLIKEELNVEEEKEVPPVLPKETTKKKKKAAPKTKQGSQLVVLVKEEPKEEEEEEVDVDQEEIAEVATKPVRRKKVKKETAKERRKREKLEKELSAMVKTEDVLHPEDHLEEFSNLTLLMETEEMTRFQFAFERVPSLEPWYAPFHRQDEGQERIFEYYGSTKYKKLPYEMGQLPPLPENCCALSHLRGTPTKSPRKNRPTSIGGAGEGAIPTRLFASARISMKRDKKKMQEGMATSSKASASTTRVAPSSSSSSSAVPVLVPRRRGRPSLASKMLQEEAAAASLIDQQHQQQQQLQSEIELSAKQKAAVTKNIVERKRKLLAELEHPRKSPREHASTLAILSCLLQQRQLNEKNRCNKGEAGSGDEDVSSRNSETASERRDSNCFERDDQEGEEEEQEVTERLKKTDSEVDEEEDGGSSEVMAATTTDGDTTETENGGRRRKRAKVITTTTTLLVKEDPEEMLLPKTPPPRAPSALLKRSNSALSGGKKKRRKCQWRARDSIDANELNKEIESLLTDPLNASAESIDSTLLDKSDAFLLPFHECPEFAELVRSVDEADYKQGFVRKSFARRSSKAQAQGPVKNHILQLDYQLRSTKKRKNRTGWPTNKRRISAAVKKGESQGQGAKSRSVSSDVKGGVLPSEEEQEEENEKTDHDEVEVEEEEVGDVEDEEGCNKRSKLTIITESAASDDENEQQQQQPEDPLQRSPILRKLLSPQWKRSESLMPSPGRGATSPVTGGRQSPSKSRGKNIRSPICELLLMDCDSPQSVSSVSMMVSDDPDGNPLPSDNTTATQSPSGSRLLKQTTLSRFFNRRRSSAVTAAAAAAAAEEEEKEKENILTDENSQEEEGEEEVEDVVMENEGVDVEDLEGGVDLEVAALGDEEEVEVEDVVMDSRRRSESNKQRNGINMNPIISIKKLSTELAKTATPVVSSPPKNRRGTKSSPRATASICSKRRRRKIV